MAAFFWDWHQKVLPINTFLQCQTLCSAELQLKQYQTKHLSSLTQILIYWGGLFHDINLKNNGSIVLPQFSTHTVILEYFNIKEEALSNFALSFQIFIATQNKKNFSNAMMHFWKNPIYPLLSAVLALRRSLIYFLDKITRWHF